MKSQLNFFQDDNRPPYHQRKTGHHLTENHSQTVHGTKKFSLDLNSMRVKVTVRFNVQVNSNLSNILLADKCLNCLYYKLYLYNFN